ncbi:MAG: flagellar biosynthetic protein FliR [Myxococcota bacterium]|nr:flagellar biosynthetic protein FliR [Myxococcota bacterium]
MILDGLLGLIEPFMLVSTRLGALITTLPIMGFEPAPKKFRAVLTIVLALGMTASLPGYVPPTSLTLGLLQEALFGATIGLTVRVILATVEMAGELISLQMGFGFNKTVDPLTKSESGPITRILSIITGVLFFATGTYQAVLRALGDSFGAFPPGASTFKPDFKALVLDAGSTMIISGARIALPLVILALIGQMCFGLMTKVAPEMNVWGLGFTFIIGFGFVGIIIFMPTFISESRDLLERSLGYISNMTLGER